MNFFEAMEALRGGKYVYRGSWKTQDLVCVMHYSLNSEEQKRFKIVVWNKDKDQVNEFSFSPDATSAVDWETA